MIAFTLLKAKIAATPILKHFDPDRLPVIVVYASKWAISAALLQEHDGMYWPVTFTSRTLKPNQVNYGMVEKEVLALLRILDVCYTTLVSYEITVLMGGFESDRLFNYEVITNVKNYPVSTTLEVQLKVRIVPVPSINGSLVYYFDAWVDD